MSKLNLMDPQMEISRYDILTSGIIDTLLYRASNGLHDTPHDFDTTPSLEERITKCESMDLPDLRLMKSELYEILLTKTGYLVRKICADVTDYGGKSKFKSRFTQFLLLNILREQNLLTEKSIYYYESMINFRLDVTFGLAFLIDLMIDQGWYKFLSKFQDELHDKIQAETLIDLLRDLSSDFHLNVLIVIWNIDRVLNYDEDELALSEFKANAAILLDQSSVKSFDYKDNMAIYLALIDVTLQECLAGVARKAARKLGLHIQHGPEETVNPLLPKLTFDYPITAIVDFINDLGERLFPNQELKDIDSLRSCSKDPKCESIIQMLASIAELSHLLKILRLEVTFPEFKFNGLDEIMNLRHKWSFEVNFDEFRSYELLGLYRFFSKEREEARYITCLAMKYGTAKFVEILWKIDTETFIDPYVIFTFCDVLERAGDEENESYIDDLVEMLRTILSLVKSKKRIAAIFKTRVEFFGLYSLGRVQSSALVAALRQKSGSVKYADIRQEILLASFLSPFEVLELVISDVVEHSHYMLEFIVKLFCFELNSPLSSTCETAFNNSLFEVLLGNRLSLRLHEASIVGIQKMIRLVTDLHTNPKKPLDREILVLDRLLNHILWFAHSDLFDIVLYKMYIVKGIKTLSLEREIPWNQISQDPKYILVSLIELMDCKTHDGETKGNFLEYIPFVMNRIVRRKIVQSEALWIHKQLQNKFTIAYLEPWLEQRISTYYNIPYISLGEVLFLATVLKNSDWLYHSQKYNLDPVINPIVYDGLAAVLVSMHKSEYSNLILFLCRYESFPNVALNLAEAYREVKKTQNNNIPYITQCLCDSFYEHGHGYLKEPKKYMPKSFVNVRPLSEQRLLVCLFRRGMVMLHRTWDEPLITVLFAYLRKLAREMKDAEVDVVKELYSSPNTMNDVITGILEQYYGPIIVPERPIVYRLIPG